MFARVSRFDVLSERIQQEYQAIAEHVIPALEMQNGYSCGLLLANSQQGKVLALSLWESERDMHVADEASRLFGAEATEGTVTDVETYEVYIARLDHPQT